VWIHGGGYVTGSGNRFPLNSIADNFVRRGVVVVTFNYRLGPLGKTTLLRSQ
jgi:para-nitrobenzyl esterase